MSKLPERVKILNPAVSGHATTTIEPEEVLVNHLTYHFASAVEQSARSRIEAPETLNPETLKL